LSQAEISTVPKHVAMENIWNYEKGCNRRLEKAVCEEFYDLLYNLSNIINVIELGMMRLAGHADGKQGF
jgi:hypothetical protein